MHEKLNYILFTTGSTTAAVGLNWSNIDLGLSIFLKFVSLASFICFLLINYSKIMIGWRSLLNTFKNKKNK